MKICSVIGCKKPYKAKGLCNCHYVKQRQSGLVGKSKCSVSGCNSFIYSKKTGMCHRHAMKIKRCNTVITTIPCPVPGCTNTMRYSSKYCHKHMDNVRKGNLISVGNAGSNNPRWNNDASVYKNSYQMKKMRKLKLKETGGMCELCHDHGKHMHHKDITKTNHAYENFIFLCRKCHIAEHNKYGNGWGRPRKAQ